MIEIIVVNTATHPATKLLAVNFTRERFANIRETSNLLFLVPRSRP